MNPRDPRTIWRHSLDSEHSHTLEDVGSSSWEPRFFKGLLIAMPLSLLLWWGIYAFVRAVL